MEYSKTKTIKGLSLGKRLFLSIVTVITVVTVLLGLYGATLTEGFMRARFEDRMTFFAHYLALNSELGILIGDNGMLEKLAKNLLSERDVVGVEIQDSNGTILVSVGDTKARDIKKAVSPVILQKEEEDLPFSQGIRGQATKIGSVYVFYSTRSIEGILKGLKTQTLVAALLLILIGGAITALISRTLTAPLKSLSRAARKVAKGKLNIRVEGGSLPETRELANAFNNMLTALEESRLTLEKTYQEMIQQRTMAEVGEFAFTVAHEIKNPLGIIQGSLDILKKAEASEETKMTMIDYLEDEVRRLNGIIQDFLMFSRPRKPRFSQERLQDLVSSVVEKTQVEWDPRGVEIDLELQGDEAKCMVDPDLFAQAILNCIKNACEACQESDAPRVLVRAGLDRGSFRIIIEDNGPGIPEGLGKKVFEPFFTTKTRGTGLGLSFVKRIVELHGGSVAISRGRTGGTYVSIELPVEEGGR